MKDFMAGAETRPTKRSKMKTAIGGQKGFTLVEMIIVIVILGIIGGITFQVVGYGVESFKKASARKDLYDQGRLALERMVREVRDGYEVTDCSDTSITFRVAHPADYGVVDEIKYQLNGTDLERVGDPSGTPLTAVLASNVTSFPVGAGEQQAGGIGVDAVSSGTTAADTDTSMTVAHTTASGSDRLMLVGISYNNDGYETVTGVTYNTVPLTLVGTAARDDDATIYIYRLVAPDTGTHDVVITFSSALDHGAVAGVMTFTGVEQTTPLGTFASAFGDGNASVTVSSAADELVFSVVSAEYATSLTPSGTQTERWNLNTDGNSTRGAGGTEAGAATVTHSWATTASGDHYAIGGVSIKPAAPTVDCTGTGVINFDAATAATSCGNCTSLSFQHTVGSGSNRVLVVTVGVERDSGQNVVSGVTYGGQPLAKIRGEIAEPGGAVEGHAELWYLLAPPSGNGTVVISTGGGSGADSQIHGGAISLEGVAQQAPEANAGNNNTGSNTISTSITTQTDGAWLVEAVACGNTGSFSVNSGQTEQYDISYSSSTHAAGTKEVATAGATAEQWTHSGANRLAHAVSAFAPTPVIFPLMSLQLTLSSEGGTVTLRTKAYMRNAPP
jgi:prepilin-type N-terminal cleavage/methylation domain-containing protein